MDKYDLFRGFSGKVTERSRLFTCPAAFVKGLLSANFPDWGDLSLFSMQEAMETVQAINGKDPVA